MVGKVWLQVAFCVFFATTLGSRLAIAQVSTSGHAVTRVDAYGNARPWYPERRVPGRYLNNAQYKSLRGAQAIGRRTNQRGGYSRFAHGGVSVGSRLSPYLSAIGRRSYAFPSAGAISSSPWISSRNAPKNSSVDINRVLARRFVLMDESSLSAPIRRIVNDQRAGLGLAPDSTAVPMKYLFDTIPSTLGQSGVEATTGPLMEDRLSTRLSLAVDVKYSTSLERAWNLFGKGEYRSSDRAFEYATIVRPDALEPRTGQLFCQMAIGSWRTAEATLGEIVRRDPLPFELDLAIADRFSNVEELRRLRLQIELYAQAYDESSTLTALLSFSFWHLGDRDEALRVAARLEESHPGTKLARWRAEMDRLLAIQVIEEQP